MATSGMDARVEEAKKWKPETSEQKVVAHGGIDQPSTEYAVVKFADMDQDM